MEALAGPAVSTEPRVARGSISLNFHLPSAGRARFAGLVSVSRGALPRSHPPAERPRSKRRSPRAVDSQTRTGPELVVLPVMVLGAEIAGFMWGLAQGCANDVAATVAWIAPPSGCDARAARSRGVRARRSGLGGWRSMAAPGYGAPSCPRRGVGAGFGHCHACWRVRCSAVRRQPSDPSTPWS
jgi:hypothetical protein